MTDEILPVTETHVPTIEPTKPHVAKPGLVSYAPGHDANGPIKGWVPPPADPVPTLASKLQSAIDILTDALKAAK